MVAADFAGGSEVSWVWVTTTAQGPDGGEVTASRSVLPGRAGNASDCQLARRGVLEAALATILSSSFL